MKTLRYVVVVLIVGFAFVLPGNGCGPFTSTAEFVVKTRPDGDYAKYLKGRVGVPQPNYRMRHLIVAYDWMNGHGLTVNEQEQMMGLDHDLYGENRAWSDFGVGRKLPGSDYETYANCLPDAYTVAHETQEARKAAHADDAASVADWDEGQAAVFANCTGNGVTLPKPVGANAPLWLKQDREYQMAAAKFYTADYDGAIAVLKGIAADAGSPWRDTARFVMARALIRKATITAAGEAEIEKAAREVALTQGRDAMLRQSESLRHTRMGRLAEARDALLTIRADPAMREYHASAARLLDFVMLRLDPAAQGQVLAARVMGTQRSQKAGQFRQAAVDLGYALGSNGQRFTIGISSAKNRASESEAEYFWLQTMKDMRPPSDNDDASEIEGHQVAAHEALAGWKKRPTKPWLIAAMTVAKPGDADAEELVRAAEAVPRSSPAWIAATYHRLRLAGGAEKRGELDALLPEMESGQARSTVNLFTMLRKRTSPTLEAFLMDAGTVPAGIGVDYDEDPDPPDRKVKSELCGAVGTQATTRLFDHDAATTLNTRMPLAMLADAAESKTLAANLRFQIAQSAWTRAVLLGRPEVAKAMTPVLVGCYPAWKPWLEKYDAAASADDRRAAGLLAMMRFASTEPIVRDGMQRPSGFAAYDEYRDNWWMESRAAKAATQNAQRGYSSAVLATFFGLSPASRDEMADPSFVTAEDRAAAESEVAALKAVPCASDYFAQAALEWQKAHPGDARTPDILGFAQRVVRNGCRTDATRELNHRMFVVTQTKYPKSEWAKKYTSWE